MPRNGKTSNDQLIEKQRKIFFKNFKKTLYKNVRLSDEKKARGIENVIASGQRPRGNPTRRYASSPVIPPSAPRRRIRHLKNIMQWTLLKISYQLCELFTKTAEISENINERAKSSIFAVDNKKFSLW